MTDKSELVRRSEAESIRNRDLSAALFKTEANHAETENNLVIRKREEEDLRLLNAGIASRNFDCRAEVEALRQHCNILAGQNGELNGELERFVETDE